MNRNNDVSKTHDEFSAPGSPRSSDTDASYLATQSQVDSPSNNAHLPEVENTSPTPAGYKIHREFGRGGMGVVYAATDTRLKRPVALKMLLSSRRDSQHLIRFLIEAEAMAQVSHPHVVQVFEAGENGGHPFLAMEYLPGGTLSERLLRESLSLDDAVKLMLKITRGVEAAHRLGIVHRDLKPSNIMFDADGEPKVTDFGLAKRSEKDLTATQATMGTPAYMAPEQAKGESKTAGPAADVYALGVMLYELTTGSRPFEGDTPATIVYQVVHDAPTLPRKHDPAIPRDIEVITLKCLEKDPRSRYADAGQLADDLQRFLNNEPISARPVGRLERTRKWIKRNPLVAASMSMTVIALLAGSGVSYSKYLDAAELRKIAELKREEAESLRQIAEQKQLEAEQQKTLSEARRLEVEQQSETARSMYEFLGGLFDDANTINRTSKAFGVLNRSGETMTALQVVDRGAQRLKTSLLDRPKIRAALLDRIGNVYIDLGRSRDAQPLLEEALQIREREFGPEHWEVGGSWNSLGILQLSLGRPELARQALFKALEIRRKSLGPEHFLVADTLLQLGTERISNIDYKKAEIYFTECLAIRQKWYAAPSQELALPLFLIAFAQLQNGDQIKAAGNLQNAAAMSDQLSGKTEISSAVNLFFKAQLAEKAGNKDKARELYAAAEEEGVRFLGDDHFIISVTRSLYAGFMREIGEKQEALRLYRKVVDGYRKSFGKDSIHLAYKLRVLSDIARDVKELEESKAARAESDRIFAMYSSKK